MPGCHMLGIRCLALRSGMARVTCHGWIEERIGTVLLGLRYDAICEEEVVEEDNVREACERSVIGKKVLESRSIARVARVDPHAADASTRDEGRD